MSRRYRKHKIDWRSRRWWIVVAIAISAFLTVPRYAWTAEKRLHYIAPADTAEVDSSQLILFYASGDTAFALEPRRDEDSAHSTVNYDTTITYNPDSSYTAILLIWYAGLGTGFPGAWPWDVNSPAVSSLSGGLSLIIAAQLVPGFTPVSLLTLTVKDEGGVTKYIQPTSSDGTLAISVSSGDWTVSTNDFGFIFPETTYTVTTNDTVLYTGTTSGVVTPPADPALAAVFGYLKDAANRPVAHQIVMAGRSKGRNATDSTSAFNIISDQVVMVETDTTGLFNFGDIGGLLRTGEYADTTQGFYNFRAEKNGQKIFELLNVYIPDTGTVNLGDTLANR